MVQWDDARIFGAAALAQALRQTRARTLGLLSAWQRALPELRVPYAQTLNPPLWELGHVGWFQEWWIGRSQERARGVACNPDHARGSSHLPQADALYDSSKIAHPTRWALPLPGLDETLRYLEAVQSDTLALLGDAGSDDNDLYFWRLVLFHECMHNEASVYMAQALGVPVPEAFARGHEAPGANTGADELALAAQTWRLGSGGAGFAFDNELGPHEVTLAGCQMDAGPVSWARYLPFIEATGHRLATHIRRSGGQWQQCRFGQWQPLNMAGPAVHLSWHDAQAWCAWAGRRLPTEAQWECAALTLPGFAWGEVWEWTASSFEPYPGFTAHPYRDYSEPWFGTRQVLRGACSATAASLLNPRYRNYFTPERTDILAGFRSCF